MIIAIIDYGVGNVKSIRNAFENQEAEVNSEDSDTSNS